MRYRVIGPNGRRFGPVPMETLLWLAHRGHIAPDSPVTEEGTDTTRRTGEFPELRRVFEEMQRGEGGVCPNCGGLLEMRAVFCPHCGAFSRMRRAGPAPFPALL